MHQFSDEELAWVDAALTNAMSRGFDRWLGPVSREDLSLEVLARLTVEAAIKKFGFNRASYFFHCCVCDLVLAIVMAEIEEQRSAPYAEKASPQGGKDADPV